jgi:hypothetical protein
MRQVRQRWTRESIAAALAAFAERESRAATVADLSPAGPGLPEYRTVVRHYGGLGAALEAAGVPAGRRPRSYVRWTPESITAALRELAADLGRTPAAVDLNPSVARIRGNADARQRFQGRTLPYMATIVANYGSLNAALEAAGLETRARGGQPRAA